jgi:hypothetical protein
LVETGIYLQEHQRPVSLKEYIIVEIIKRRGVCKSGGDA